MRLVWVIKKLFFGSRHPRKNRAYYEGSANVVHGPWAQREPSIGLNFGPDTLPHPQPALVGRCWVIDGDTIDIAGTRIRLAGIDAPELDHPYGKNAKSFLIKLCAGQEIRAVFDGALSHDRSVATCFLPDGRDLSAEMVKAGHALDWTKFSKGKYLGLEATDARKRLWRCVARQQGKMPQHMPD